jgi:hypothetical protein
MLAMSTELPPTGRSQRRASLPFAGRLNLATSGSAYGQSPNLSNVDTVVEMYSDMREHGDKGPIRTVRLHRVASNGGGMIARSEGDDGRCVVAGRECMCHSLGHPPAQEI